DVAKSNRSPRGEIKVDSRTNALVVRDIPDSAARVETIIHDLHQRTAQVQIEARIVQANKNFARGLGIQWGISSIARGNIGSSPLTVNVGASGATVGTQANDFFVNLPASASGVSVPGSTIGLLVRRVIGGLGSLGLLLLVGMAVGYVNVCYEAQLR